MKQSLDMQHLTQHFKRFRDLGLNPSITVATRAREFFTCRRRDINHPFTKKVNPRSPHDIQGISRRLDAMVRSKYWPLEFNINGDTPGNEIWYLPIHGLVQNGFLDHFSDALSLVQTLRLDVWVVDHAAGQADEFFRRVAKLEHLKSLKVYGRDERDPYVEDTNACDAAIAEVLMACRYPQLKKLRLSGCWLFATDLVEFLIRQKEESGLDVFEIRVLAFEWAGIGMEVNPRTYYIAEKIQKWTGVRVIEIDE